MIVIAALRAGFRIASRPHAPVHGVDGRFTSCERISDEQTPRSLGVDPPSIQSCVKATPAATMGRGFEAQVNRRRDTIRGEDGVSEFEEGVGPTMEAFVE
jgi:hypothetical protein